MPTSPPVWPATDPNNQGNAIMADAISITAQALRSLLASNSEYAVLDVRETGAHSRDGHILRSVSLPLSKLELLIATLVPRPNTEIILYDDGSDTLARRAAIRLAELGYHHSRILTGGTQAWKAAGFELFTGVNVLGKTFGEHIEHQDGTPHITVQELKHKFDAGEKVVVIDSRPVPEFHNFTIPGAINLPGAEIVNRFHQAQIDPDALVVVNCAGRTRSIIGAQALINAGVPNRVVDLANGTMDWLLAGWTLDHGRQALVPPPEGAALQAARESAQRLHQRFDLKVIDHATLERFRAEQDAGLRSLHLVDVRTSEEYRVGHPQGAISAEGGQLVQQHGAWIGTQNGRIVLVDDENGVRAAITASWLVQINWGEVYILADALKLPLAIGPQPGNLAAPVPSVETVTPGELIKLLATGNAQLLDLQPSLSYEKAHIPGARFAIRAYLHNQTAVPGSGTILLTSEDGALAAFAAADLKASGKREVLVLRGGNKAWQDAGLELTDVAAVHLHPAEDAWRTPYQRPDREAAFREYLDWEIQLVDQLERDGTARFRSFPLLEQVRDAAE
jgi:rhodanese-related sulfurtransferase